ncbi:MAG: RnfABCDGE type electron transport complex subunit G, partial [Candidatus Atribacteria bacterium]|nr:RnfABCDGE type electron transport complex subunit G [Candidatus Atribacteria bacterium]
NQMTQREIVKNAEKELQDALAVLFPGTERFEKMELPPASSDGNQDKKDFSILEVYNAMKNNASNGYVLKISSKGYGGPIILLLALSTQENELMGMKVLDNQETPGLGSEITKPGFQNQFTGKSMDDAFELNQDIQAISGATISSRAVVKTCQGAVAFVKERGRP